MSSRGRVHGKIALVTGAASGIGAACAQHLAREGATVVLTDRDAARGAAAAAALGAPHGFLHHDVTDEDGWAATVARVVADHGRLDVLVNSAGIGVLGDIERATVADLRRMYAVNVEGTFVGCRAAIGAMKLTGGGSIINLSSIYGLVGAPDTPPYHASKGAVRLMSKTDAMIYAPDKIRVNSVHPGFIWTPMVEAHLKSAGELEEGKAATAALHPLGHMGEPDDIAWGAVYLASDEAKFVTGSELVIDGGYTAR